MQYFARVPASDTQPAQSARQEALTSDQNPHRRANEKRVRRRVRTQSTKVQGFGSKGGDRLGGCGQLAAFTHGLRHRAGRTSGREANTAGERSARGPQSDGPRRPRRAHLHDQRIRFRHHRTHHRRRESAQLVLHAASGPDIDTRRHRGAVAARFTKSAQRRRLAQSRAAVRRRHAHLRAHFAQEFRHLEQGVRSRVQSHRGQRRHHDLPHDNAAQKQRTGDAARLESVPRAAHLSQLFRRRGRSGRGGRRGASQPEISENQAHEATEGDPAENAAARLPKYDLRLGRILEMRGPKFAFHHLPPFRHLSHGSAKRSDSRRRSQAEGDRREPTEGRRRVHHAGGYVGTHQLADYNDRRKSFGHD